VIEDPKRPVAAATMKRLVRWIAITASGSSRNESGAWRNSEKTAAASHRPNFLLPDAGTSP
jgi:hypothetical protein